MSMISQIDMKAAILVELHKPLVVDTVFLPKNLNIGQVLVKVCFSGICGSQIGEIDCIKGEDKYLPHLLGHEGSGKVIEIGPGVNHVKRGDHVVLHWRQGVGINSEVPNYSWNNQPLNAGYVTTFNEYAIVSENRLTPIPDEFNLEFGALMGCAVTTGLGVITNNACLRMGESIVIFGAGGVGLSIIQGASLTSAHPIIAVDLYDNKLELASRLGATHTINSIKSDPKGEIIKVLQGQGADVVIDNTGNTSIISMAYEMTKPKGKTVLVGVPRAQDNVSVHTLPLHFGKVITGSHGGETDPTNDIPRYINLYNTGKLKLKDMITERFSLDHINVAIDMMRRGEIAGRCIIEM